MSKKKRKEKKSRMQGTSYTKYNIGASISDLLMPTRFLMGYSRRSGSTPNSEVTAPFG